MRIFLIVIISLTLTAVSAFAQAPDASKLEEIAAKQKQAEQQAAKLKSQQDKLKKELRDLQNDLVKVSAQSRGFEKAETDARDKLLDLQIQENEIKNALLTDQENIVDLLAALQRIQRKPPPALLSSAKSATDAARAAGLISHLGSELNEKSERLRATLTTLETVRTDIVTNQSEIATNSKEVEMRLLKIKEIIAKKKTLNRQLDKRP